MSDLDEAVARLLAAEQRGARVRSAPVRKRKEVKRQQARSRISVEIDPRIKRLVWQIAEREGCSPAAIINLYLLLGIGGYEERLSIPAYKEVCETSPRWDYTVPLTEYDEQLDRLDASGFGND